MGITTEAGIKRNTFKVVYINSSYHVLDRK